MENAANWRTESRTVYSSDFKLRMVELASRPDANVAQLAREHGVDPLHIRSDSLTIRPGISPQCEVLAHRKIGEHPPALGHHGDAFFHDLRGLESGQILTFEQYLPGCHFHQTADRPECCSLAGAIGAYQADDLTFVHLQIYALQGVNAIVMYVQAADLKHRHRPPNTQ